MGAYKGLKRKEKNNWLQRLDFCDEKVCDFFISQIRRMQSVRHIQFFLFFNLRIYTQFSEHINYRKSELVCNLLDDINMSGQACLISCADCFDFRYLNGLNPYFALKHRIKYCVLSKPHSDAIKSIDSSVDKSIFSAEKIRSEFI